LSFSQKGLKSGGVLALGSRNRLFNLHSLNEFTELESTLGTVANLLLESRTIQSAKSQQEAIAHLELLAMEYPQPILHPLTGVKVETRYQFSPADLLSRLGKYGLKARRIFPIHYHPLPIALLANPEFKKIHNHFAKFASDNWMLRHSLVPYSSSFVIEAQKT
jgi:hypothetical protein